MLNFTTKDKEKLTELLNEVATKATFKELTIRDIIRLYGLFAYAQKELLEKIDNNLLEVVRQVTPEKPKRVRSKKA